MKRRALIHQMLACSALVLARPLRAVGATMPAPGITHLPLWDRMIPGGGTIAGEAKRSATGALSHIVTPMLEVFTPARANGSAALIAGGGGYKRIEMESEAYPAARWLAQ